MSHSGYWSTPVRGAVVYYIRKDGLIKIGHSTQFRARMDVLEPDEVLAIEPGNYQRETMRHRQFADARATRRDWFHPTSELLAHIAELPVFVSRPTPHPQVLIDRYLAPNEQSGDLDDDLIKVPALAAKAMAREDLLIGRLCDALHERGWSWRQLEAELGMPQATVRRRVERAMEVKP